MAARCNNLGVQLLLLQPYSDHSIETFQHAAHLIKEITEVTVRTSFLQVDTNSNLLSTHHLPMLHNPCRFQLQAYKSLGSLDKGAYYVYNRPFVLPTFCVQSNPMEFATRLITSSAVIVFNLGISFHQYSRQCERTAPLHHAMLCYQLTLRMIVQNGIQRDFGNFLMCVTLNNLANIHNDLCDFDSSKTCLDRLRVLIGNDSHIRECASDFMNDAEWSALKLNILYSRFSITAQAA